ncbi:hypothetical protein D623_10014031 [Myotis brandtii]|uniref:Uncharacterized protein n=1 Tax=Myotis brandtii TaxID=109478 RepID=S7NKD8_MYOBR|nr:hypothetical protein D623_10014031 [Myotis brandtii]
MPCTLEAVEPALACGYLEEEGGSLLAAARASSQKAVRPLGRALLSPDRGLGAGGLASGASAYTEEDTSPGSWVARQKSETKAASYERLEAQSD